MLHLKEDEKQRLTKALRAAFAIPFIDDIEDYIWEAVLAYAKNIPLVDPFSSTRAKDLFDFVDTSAGVGWSAKALQWQVAPEVEFELVIQRADIFKKASELGFGRLSSKSPPEDLGAALLTHWHQKVDGDAKKQGVSEKRVAILVKSLDRRTFAYYEDLIALYSREELRWKWTDRTRTGLQGIRKRDRFVVYRWYPNQKQFFERFTLPKDAYVFTLDPKRIQLPSLVELIDRELGSIP
jgi:hypothetical protein